MTGIRAGARRWLAALLLVPLGLSAQPPELELKVKAAYLYHFTKFVEWPSQPPEPGEMPLRICLLGDSGLEPYLAPLQERTMDTHTLTVDLLSEADDTTTCQLLFIARDQRESLTRLLTRLEGQPVLTVSSIEDFAARGGMIGFVRHDGRVRLEMNLASLRRAGLQVNAQLIEVCLKIYGEVQAP